MRSTVRRALVIAAMLCVPVWVFGDEQPGRTELGFVPLGVSVSFVSDDTLTVVGVPAGGFFGSFARGVYLQVFATDRLAIEPQLSATGLFGGGDHFRIVSGAVRVNYLFQGADAPSGYLFGGAGLWHVGGDGANETNPTLGLGIGYRQPIRSAGSVRVELGYERQIEDGSDGTNVLNLSVGVALRF